MYTDPKTLSALLCGHLRAVKALKSVSFAAISDQSQLMRTAKSVSGSPKAVICYGTGDYEARGLIRKARLGIVILIPFQPEQSLKALELLDAVAERFVPPVKLGDKITVELLGWSPLETDAQTIAFVVDVEMSETR